MKPALFSCAIATGMLCSLAAIAIQVAPRPFASGDPSFQASASPAPDSAPLATAMASVTESLPAAAVVEAETDAIVDTAGVAAVPTPYAGTEPRPLPPVEPGTAVVALEPHADLEMALLDRMNGARFEYGLPGLERYDYLDAVALTRAESLAAGGYFDHVAPDGTSAFTELATRGILYRLAGENLARNNHPERQTVEAAFTGLMASPGHRQNILEPMFGAVGVASVQSGGMWYHVTVFTNPR